MAQLIKPGRVYRPESTPHFNRLPIKCLLLSNSPRRPLWLLLLFCVAGTFYGKAQTTKTVPNLNSIDAGHSGKQFIFNDTVFLQYYEGRSWNPLLRLAKYTGSEIKIIPPLDSLDKGFEEGTLMVMGNKLYGIAASRLQTIAAGSAEPVAPNTTEANKEKNRRVTVSVLE